MTVNSREVNLKARSLQIKGEDLVKRLKKASQWHQEKIEKGDLAKLVVSLAADVNEWKKLFIQLIDIDDESAQPSSLISHVTMAKLWALETDVSLLWNEVRAISVLLNLLPKSPESSGAPENEVAM